MLGRLTRDLDAAVTAGSKVLEIRTSHIDKGGGVREWLERDEWDFVLEIGDDRTDEDGFAALPKGAFSIKVGTQPSLADHYVQSVAEVRTLLRDLGNT